MKKGMRLFSVALVLVVFALMALGSGGASNSTSENKDADSATSVTTESGTQNESSSNTQKPAESENPYEVGDGKVAVYKNSIGSVWVQISVPVKNTGEANLYLSSGTMDLEDKDGHLVESRSMVSVYPQVLKPGETAWYYEETILDEEPSGDLKVIPHVDVEKASVDCIRYEVSDLSLADDTYGGVKLTGRVENTTDEDESMPYVIAFLYDANDEFIGQAFTIMDNLKAGEKMGFSMSTTSSNDALKAENVDRYEIYAYPIQFQF